jgi:hypothetical protein
VSQVAKRADIPVEQPTHFRLVATSKPPPRRLGLTIPESFLLRADVRSNDSMLRCMSPQPRLCKKAHRFSSRRCTNSVAIGGIADIVRSTAVLGSDANDPNRHCEKAPVV